MKRIIASLLVLLTLISIPSLSAADTASLALQADSAYNREDYRAAIDLYRAAIAADGPSTVVYYNLGNAYFRNDNLGKAVVAYERAPASRIARRTTAPSWQTSTAASATACTPTAGPWPHW